MRRELRVAVLLLGLLCIAVAARPQTQSSDWEDAAGGKMAFDVASVRQNTSGLPPHGDPVRSNVPLGPDDSYAPTGGLLLLSDHVVADFILFAYKLNLREEIAMNGALPKWARTERFNIEARGRANATKDQMRLMMQSLLADRFKLAVHFETHEQPILNLLLAEPGKTGPQLTRHSDSHPCVDPAHPVARAADANGATLAACGLMLARDMPDGSVRVSATDVTMQKIADDLAFLPPVNADRPVVDETGLSGEFDFDIDLPKGLRGGISTDPTAPSFVDILRDQLGLKLESATGPVRTIVIDHIEEPNAN
ncbi:MAG TPA: TIGR03435 family protein [Terriglobales bacterium]|nr:TIGR03435 family protein [Terriglobales bacterium]